MRHQFFSINALDSQTGQEALNRFCASHPIASIEKHFVPDGTNSFWSLCVEYIDGAEKTPPGRKEKIDYKEVLSEKDFAVYSKLRNLRKTLADKEGVPVYSLFTNEQLATMVKERPLTASAMLQIDGVGKARVDKYGDEFTALLQGEHKEETSGETDTY